MPRFSRWSNTAHMKYVVSILSAILLSGAAVAQTEAIFMEETPLTIITDNGPVSITAELANDPEETATGLMFRDGIDAGRGMIFDFGAPREANMYMRNVPFPIDMLFLDTDGTVLATVSHVQAQSERRINPGFPVKGVLELADGQVSELGVKPGDRVEHQIFGSVAAEEPAPEVPASED